MNDENAEPNPIVEAVQESLCSRGEIPVDLARQTEGTDLEAMLSCSDLHDQLPTLIPSLLEAARDDEHRAALLEVAAYGLIKRLGSLPEAAAKKCLEHVGLELGCLSNTQLVALMEFDLGRISSALGTPNGGADSLHLLPKCLNLLVTIEACSMPLADGSTARDGAGIVSYALRSILAASWPPAGVLRLAMSLRELEVPKAGLKPHLAKMLRHLSEIEMAQLPAMTYQLLLLADAESKTTVLRALTLHFDSLLKQCEQASDTAELVPQRLDREQLGHIQGAVVLHIQLAVKQDQPLGMALLKMVKSGHMQLGGFSLSLLLSLARIRRFEEATVACVVSLIRNAMQLRAWCASSPWLAQLAGPMKPSQLPEDLLLGAVHASSAGGWDHLVPSLVALASALLDVAPPTAATALLIAAPDRSSANEDALHDRLPAATRLPLLGKSMLLEAFIMHPMVRAEVMEALCSRVVARGDSVQHWVALLQDLVSKQPTLVLEHTERLKQLLEYVLHLPPAVAAPMLRSLLPLQRQRPDLRDQLVMLLRKAMFHREEELRLTAVHGFLMLLHGTADTPSTTPGAAGSTAPVSLQFQLELLGFIRRSFSQQASIRTVLYEGLVVVFEQQQPLRELVTELLSNQLRQYHLPASSRASQDGVTQADSPAHAAAGAEAPLALQACLRATAGPNGEESVALIEPLPDLIRAIVRCTECIGEAEATPPPGLAALRSLMTDVVHRFGMCSIPSLGFSDKAEMSQATSPAALTLARAGLLERVLEALLEWSVLCDSTMAGTCAEPQPSTAPSQLTASARLLPECARVLFKLLIELSARLKETKALPRGKKPVNMPKLGEFSLSLRACERVLRMVATDQAPASAGKGSHFVRYVLRACEAQARRVATDESAALRCGRLQHSESHRADLRSVASIGRLLLSLVPRAELQTGKEAPSGRLNANPLTGEKDAQASTGKQTTKTADKAARAAMASRLQLILDAVLASAAALCSSPTLLPLGTMLMPLGVSPPLGPISRAGGPSQPAATGLGATQAAPTSIDVLELTEGYLMRELLPLAQRLAYDDSHREAETAMALVSQLTGVLPAARLKKAHGWSACVCKEEAHLSLAVRKCFLSTHLSLERASGCGRSGSAAVAKELYLLLGDNQKEDEDADAPPERWGMLEEGSANSMCSPLIETVDTELAELSHASALMLQAMELARATAADTEVVDPTVDALERAMCERYKHVASVVRLLLKSQIEGAPAQALLRSCTTLFKQLEAVFRAIKSPSKRMELLLSHVCGETGVTVSMYGLLGFSSSSDAMGASSARVIKEAKIVPALIFQLERFEAAVVKLSKSSGRDLLRFMKRATARDFKIQAEEVVNAIRKAEEDAGDEGTKKSRRKRPAGSASGSTTSKKGKPADCEPADPDDAEADGEDDDDE